GYQHTGDRSHLLDHRQPIFFERRSGFDQIDDEVGQTYQGCELDRALHVNDLGLDASRREVIGGDARILGSDAGYIRHGTSIDRRRHYHPAPSDAEVERLVEVVAPFEQNIASRNAEVGGPELDVGGYVVGLEQEEAKLPVRGQVDEPSI